MRRKVVYISFPSHFICYDLCVLTRVNHTCAHAPRLTRAGGHYVVALCELGPVFYFLFLFSHFDRFSFHWF